MVQVRWTWLWGITAIVWMASSAYAGSPAFEARLEAGIAQVDITPTEKEVLDPLLAKALVFRQGSEQAAVVVCDVIGISGEISSTARKQAAEQTGIPAAHICIAATHTHSGGYRDDLAGKIVEVIGRAH